MSWSAATICRIERSCRRALSRRVALVRTAWVASLALLVLPASAHAGACCLSASLFGVGRLVIWEEAAAGTTLSVGQAIGDWDLESQWGELPEGFAERETRVDAFAIVRLEERWQAFARLPWVLTERVAGTEKDLGQGLGDAQVGARYDLIGIGEFVELPAVALTASVGMPSGKRAEASTALGASATGRGIWSGALALSIEKAIIPWFARFDVGVTASLPFEREDLGLTQRYGPGLQMALSGGRELIADKLVLGFALSEEWEAPLAIDGEKVVGSAARSGSGSVALSWNVTPHWSLQTSVASALGFDDVGRNRPARVSGTLGVRYGYF